MAKTDRHDRITQRAKEIWEAEGHPEGRAAEHWARAEKEIADAETTSEMSHTTAAGTAPDGAPEPAKTPRATAASKGEGKGDKPASASRGRKAKAGEAGAGAAAAPAKPRRKKAE